MLLLWQGCAVQGGGDDQQDHGCGVGRVLDVVAGQGGGDDQHEHGYSVGRDVAAVVGNCIAGRW